MTLHLPTGCCGYQSGFGLIYLDVHTQSPHGPKQAQTTVNDETFSRHRPVPILPKQTIKAIWGSLQSGITEREKKAALSTPTLLPSYTVTVAAGTPH